MKIIKRKINEKQGKGMEKKSSKQRKIPRDYACKYIWLKSKNVNKVLYAMPYHAMACPYPCMAANMSDIDRIQKIISLHWKLQLHQQYENNTALSQ